MQAGQNKIPDSLLNQLNGYKKRVLLTDSLLTISLSLSLILISFFVTFLSDRFWNTPTIVRISIILLGFVPFLLLVIKWSINWIWKRQTAKDLAIKIQKNHKRLGDRLLGIIELSEGSHEDESISEELMEAAIAKIANQAKEIDFNADVDKSKPIKFAILAIFLIASTILLYHLLPVGFSKTITRWINPLSQNQRFTFTQLSPLPSEKNVPAGDPFEIECSLASNSYWKPKELSWQITGIKKYLNFKNNKATIKIAGINKKSILKISTGDTSQEIILNPIQRPILKTINAKIKLPSYTGRKDKLIDISGGILPILKGSKYILSGTINREIQTATINNVTKKEKVNLKVHDNSFKSLLKNANATTKFQINWKDKYKLHPTIPFDLQIDVQKDVPPFIESPATPNFAAILKNESLTINLIAKDDYGVKNVFAEIAIVSIKDKKIKNPKVRGIFLANGGKLKNEIHTQYIFNPKLLKINEHSLVSYKSAATDYFNQKPSYSNVHYIYILSNEEHSKLIRQRLEEVKSEIEDLIRREKRSLFENEKIRDLSDKKLFDQKTTDKISEQKIKEKSEKRKLEKLIQKANNLMKEALRNKNFPDNTIKEWSKLSELMKSISDQNMKKMQQSLNNAEKQQQRRENMKQAVKDQKDMINKLKKMVDSMDKSLKDLVVMNFINRLKEIAKSEKNLNNNIKRLFKDIIGVKPVNFKNNIKKEYKAQQELHNEITQKLEEIKSDLNAFFTRTRIKKYKTVTDDMEKKKVTELLDTIKQSLINNQTSKILKNSNLIKQNINEWIKMLSNLDNKKENQQQNKSQKPMQQNLEAMLKILRIINDEQNLRDQTRAVHKNQKNKDLHKKQSNMLANTQNDICKFLQTVKEMVTESPQALKMLNGAEHAMNDAENNLKQANSGSSTIAAETEVIERLSGAFQKMSQKSGKGSGMQMMQMLMQMMRGRGKGSGKTAGKSSAGGFTNEKNMIFNEKNFKKNEGERDIDKAGGTSTITLPEEYKNDIESFYKKLEKLK